MSAGSPSGPAATPPRNLHCRAILFDMDGTLVDSTPVVEAAWALWSARHGIPLAEILAYSHGRPGAATLQHFRPGHDPAADLAELARYEATHLDGITAVPGAAALLRALAGHPWAVVTSASRKLAEARLAAAGLPLPAVLVPIDEVRHGKPNPEGFLKAAGLLNIAPRECLVFEDTRPGIDAALRAGMRVVGLLTTLPAGQLNHTPLIRDFHDVLLTPDHPGHGGTGTRGGLTLCLRRPPPAGVIGRSGA